MEISRNPEIAVKRFWTLFINGIFLNWPQASSFCPRGHSTGLWKKNSATLVFTLCWGGHIWERRFNQANWKFCPSGTCHRSEFDLLCRGVELEAGEVEMSVFLTTAPNGSDTAGCSGVCPGVRTPDFLRSRPPPRLCGQSSVIDRSATSDPFQITRRRTRCLNSFSSILMQVQGRPDSFESYAPNNMFLNMMLKRTLQNKVNLSVTELLQSPVYLKRCSLVEMFNLVNYK